MSRRNPRAKWVLPNVVDPPTSTCWIVPVPDDDFHRAAFLGALAALGSAYKWQDDPAHTAIAVANVWRRIADNLQRCPPPPKPIIDDEFEDEMNLCDIMRYQDGHLQIMCCGEWQNVPGFSEGGGPPQEQPPAHDRPGPGESGCYNLSLRANDGVIFPFPVSTGDTITITGLSGGWNDGTLAWYCGNGQFYGAGGCFGTPHTDGGDPYPAVHMALVGLLDGVYAFDVGSSPFTIPSGVAGANLTFQANDSSLADNKGSISFNVCVENGTPPPASSFCHVFDFATGDQQGWSVYAGDGAWNGHGFDTINFGGFTAVIIGRSGLDGIGLTKITVVGSIDVPSTDGNTTAVFNINGTTLNSTGGIAGTGGGAVNDFYEGAIASVQQVLIRGNGTGTGYISKVVIEGIGTNPFSQNC